jgi:hypothetical protein
MYRTSADVAKAALRLLAEAKTMIEPQQHQTMAEHVLAANVLANQVYDWHVRQYGKRTATGEAALDVFKRHYAEHETINSIANGTKHPFARYPDVSKAHVRKIEWEDPEFWDAFDGQELDMLFVTDNNGQDRAVATLVETFCAQYVRNDDASIHSTW